MNTHDDRSGFTLLELSVVLVLIGLLTGAILAGQELVKASAIRGSISDLEKYYSAVATFRSKYTGLPGDLTRNKAVEFNLSGPADANATGAVGLRDGNTLIEGGGPGSTSLIGETALFWKDLGSSGLIGGSYTAAGTTITTGANVTGATSRSYLPATRFRENASHFVYSVAGRNFVYLATITTDAASAVTTSGALTPLEAKGIDEKTDDGSPTSGSVLSMLNLSTPDPGAPAGITACNTNATPSVYNVTRAATGAIDRQVCQLQLRTSF